MRYCLVFLLALIGSVAFGQEIISQKKISLRGENVEALPVWDSLSETTKLFLIDKDSIRGVNVSTQGEDGKILAVRKPSKFPDALGYTIYNGKYNIFFSNSNHTAFAVTSFDFTTGAAMQRIGEMKMKGERFVAAASYKNRFYTISVVRETSTLKVYAFDDIDKFEVKTFSFGASKFGPPQKSTIDQVIANNPVVFVDNTIPNSLEITANASKLYAFDDKLVFTFNNFVQYTSMITIDLNTWREQITFYNNPALACDETYNLKVNSYIFKDKLYQFSVCPSGMVFSVADTKTKTIVKKYSVDRDQEMMIANTPIHQEGSKSPYGPSERELSKTKQFLRKVSNSRAGVAATEGSNGLQVTLGASEEFNANFGAPSYAGGPAPMSISTPQGIVAVPTYSYVNPVHNGFRNYVATFSVYVKCLFEPVTLEHKAGEVSDNVFDAINKYLTKIDSTPDLSNLGKTASTLDAKTIRAQTVFKHGEQIILGYYDPKSKYYVLRKF
jgi:hypothetical protein